MKKELITKILVLITNIFTGFLFGFILLGALYFQNYHGLGCWQTEYYTCLFWKCVTGFIVTTPIMFLMWGQTYAIKDRSILFLGGPLLSISIVIVYSFIPLDRENMYQETPYILLAFVLFYSFLQLAMYYIVKRKQKKIWTGFPMEEMDENEENKKV